MAARLGLDRSLDEIVNERKPAPPAGGGRRARKPKSKAVKVVAPTGGVTKKKNNNTKAASATTQAAVAALTSGGRESKVNVSNLPSDVTEPAIREFFNKYLEGSVKEVLINYGPNRKPRGTATVTFKGPTRAAEAAKMSGTLVDNKPLRIEILVSAKNVAAPAPKSLLDRVTKPKGVKQDKPKSAVKTAANGKANGTAKNDRARTEKNKTGRAGKPKRKTAEELDAEMEDYFGGGPVNGNTNGAAAAVDQEMDEVL